MFLLDFLMEDYGVFVDKGVRGKTSTYPETKASLSQFQYGSGNFSKGWFNRGHFTTQKQKMDGKRKRSFNGEMKEVGL